MGWSILVYASGDRYVPFTVADLLLYDMMRDVLSTEEGIKRYGMRFVEGRKDIPDEEIDAEVKKISGLVDRMNRGEHIDLGKELKSNHNNS